MLIVLSEVGICFSVGQTALCDENSCCRNMHSGHCVDTHSRTAHNLNMETDSEEEGNMITLRNVSKEYVPGEKALDDVSIQIYAGEFVFVMGESGSGKSTLIKLLQKEIEPSSGKMIVQGQDLAKIKRRRIPHYRRKIGVVYQDFRLLQDRNVYENVAFALRVISASRRKIKKAVPNMLSLVGLAAKYKSKPNQLSGGEQQRVSIARALVNDPKILMADEPTGNLDENNAWEIMKLLEEVNKRGTTVLVVTHNIEIVRRMNKRVITLQNGSVISDTGLEGDTDEN